jgi:aflatoxin B1 aldehyde reductase
VDKKRYCLPISHCHTQTHALPKQFGVSNLRAEEVEELYKYASSKNYVLPTVYQGNYNLLSRTVETELFPLLRKLGISFYAYSPLCCGILINAEAKLRASTGRWDTSHFGGKYMNNLYNKPSYIAASKKFQATCEARGISPAGAAYRWMRYHSALKQEFGDGLVIGASSKTQLSHSLEEMERGPLDDDLVGELESLWDVVKDDAPPYCL